MNRRARILLIDDDHSFVEATRTILESKPYDVFVAYDGDEGLRKAREVTPDLILLDIIMPVKDGFAAAEQLKKDPKMANIPILMLTSFASQRAGTAIPVGRGLALEAEDYIDKPVSPEDLLSTVARYLKKAGF